MDDLLSRIAKALDDPRDLCCQTHREQRLGQHAAVLLPECHAALKIAVEALGRVATCGRNGVSEAGCSWCLDADENVNIDVGALVGGEHLAECPIGHALSRITSAAEKPRETE